MIMMQLHLPCSLKLLPHQQHDQHRPSASNGQRASGHLGSSGDAAAPDGSPAKLGGSGYAIDCVVRFRQGRRRCCSVGGEDLLLALLLLLWWCLLLLSVRPCSRLLLLLFLVLWWLPSRFEGSPLLPRIALEDVEDDNFFPTSGAGASAQ